MKVLLLKNNIPDENALSFGITKVKELLATINFPLEFDERITNRVFTSVPFIGSSLEVLQGWHINPQQILDEEKKFGDYEIVCLVFDPGKISPVPPTNPTDNAEIIQIPTNWYGSYPEVFAQFFLHELCHERFWATGRPDITHNFYTSPFAQLPDGITKYYLYLLSGLIPVTPPAPVVPPTTGNIQLSPNFILQEFVSKEIYEQWGKNAIWFVDPRIVKLAQFLRDYFKRPVTINNWHKGGPFNARGFREPESNVGAKMSQHRFSRAIDVNVAGMTPKAVYGAILAQPGVFMGAGLTTMEDIQYTPGWCHLDIRQTNEPNIKIVKPL